MESKMKYNENEIASLKQIWAQVINSGKLCNPDACWNFYGGGLEVSYKDFKKFAKEFEKFKSDIKTFGVAWYEMDLPEYSCETEFQGTFFEGEYPDIHSYKGWVILNNGEKKFVAARDIDLRSLYQQFNERVSSVDLVSEIFGDK
jgi:hypothetical protein